MKFPDEAAYYLLYLDASGNDFGDTWHASIDDALAQAEYEYPGIGGAWVEVGADEDSALG